MTRRELLATALAPPASMVNLAIDEDPPSPAKTAYGPRVYIASPLPRFGHLRPVLLFDEHECCRIGTLCTDRYSRSTDNRMYWKHPLPLPYNDLFDAVHEFVRRENGGRSFSLGSINPYPPCSIADERYAEIKRIAMVKRGVPR